MLCHTKSHPLILGIITFTVIMAANPLMAQQSSAEALAEQGIAAYKRGEVGQALHYLNKAVEADPRYARVRYNRCFVYHRADDVKRALADCEQAFRLDPEYVDAYYLHGVILSERLGEDKRAIQDFDQAIRLAPQLVAAYFKRGNAHARTGDIDSAIADYTKAIQLDPQDAVAVFNRGVLYHQMGKNDAAVQDFASSLSLYEKQGNQAGMERAGAAIDTIMGASQQ